MPLEMRRVNTEDGVTEILWGLINFRGPAFLADMKRRPYPHYSFFDLLYSEEQLARGAEARHRSMRSSRTRSSSSA